MTTITCPSCHHSFTSPAVAQTGGPDASVVRWFSSDQSWTGEISTAEAYATYLRAVQETPASRATFVATLAYVGIDEVLDGDTRLLIQA